MKPDQVEEDDEMNNADETNPTQVNHRQKGGKTTTTGSQTHRNFKIKQETK